MDSRRENLRINNMNINLDKINRIHFIGIGGIMMSAVAKYFINRNKTVTGSDQDHKASNLPKNTDLVIYTVAISKNNPELKKAKKLKIPVYSVYQVLGMLSRGKYTIAIAGMHGKSTTTAMLGLILEKAKLDPTVFVGTKIKKWSSNFRAGKSKYLLTEACEYKDNFLELHPDILVINNIEEEHLDYFKNFNNIKQSFKKLISQIKPGGYLIINQDDKNLRNLVKSIKKIKIIKFKHKNLKLKIPGKFNRYNASAAFAVANILKINEKLITTNLANFPGIWRRFEYKGQKNNIKFYDDYAHHPTEIKATLEMAKEKFKNKNWWLVFQPHLYSRTKDFLPEFAASLNIAPNLIITDIYAAREKNKYNISSEDIVPGKYIKQDQVVKYLSKKLKPGDIVITMGAGDVYKIGEKLISMLK